MAETAQMIISLGGKKINAFKNWTDLKIRMDFENRIDPYLEIDDFIFVNEQIELIQTHLDTAGIFEGMPLVISLQSASNTYEFNSLIDLTTLKIDSPVQWRAKVKVMNGRDNFEDRATAISYGYLVENQIIGKGDYTRVPVVIKKKFDTTEVIIVSLSLFIVSKTLYETYKDTAEKLIKAAKVPLAAGATAAEILDAVGTIIYIIAYYALLLIAIYKLLEQLKKNLIPRVTHYKGITLRKALQKALEYLGYTLDTDIGDFDNFVYLPSKTDDKVRNNANDEGIPNVSDYGYQVIEMFELAFQLTNSKYTIIGRTFYIRNKNSDFWRNISNNEMPSHIAMEGYKYNAFEMFANTLIHFQYDASDNWTMPSNNDDNDYSIGTNFEAIVDYENGGNSLSKMQKGLREVSIPLALGKRREKLSFFEVYVKVLFGTLDLVIRAFGGTTVASKINEHRGRLMISDPSFNVAKLIYLDGGYIPANHRTTHLSARAIYEKYYVSDSFVNNATRAQRLLFEDIKVPFNFENFIGYINNPFFKIEQDSSAYSGKQGKLSSIEWFIGGDYANANFYIEQQYNKTKLTETWIES